MSGTPEDVEESARWEAAKHPEPPPDMSGFKMETIREGDGPLFRVFAAACVVVFVAVMALLCVQYGRALESCHSDGLTRVPLAGCHR